MYSTIFRLSLILDTPNIAIEYDQMPDGLFIPTLIDSDSWYISSYDDSYLGILKHKCPTKINMLDDMDWSYRTWDPKTQCSKNTAPSLRSPTDWSRGLSCFKSSLSYMSECMYWWMYLPQYESFLEHCWILFNYMRQPVISLAGLGCIW